jgi:hypothetical protein
MQDHPKPAQAQAKPQEKVKLQVRTQVNSPAYSQAPAQSGLLLRPRPWLVRCHYLRHHRRKRPAIERSMR